MTTPPSSDAHSPAAFRTLRVCVPAFLMFNVVLPEPAEVSDADEAEKADIDFYERARQTALETLQRRLDCDGGFDVPAIHSGGRCYTSRDGNDLPPRAAVEIEDECEATEDDLEDARLDGDPAVPEDGC